MQKLTTTVKAFTFMFIKQIVLLLSTLNHKIITRDVVDKTV